MHRGISCAQLSQSQNFSREHEMTDEPSGAIEEIQSALEMPGHAELAPVYAEFGAAIHDTQVLEFGLVLLMALCHLKINLNLILILKQ